MKTLRSTTQVIEALGGNIPVAGMLGTTNKAVSNWRRSKFPANTYCALQIVLLAKDIYAPVYLWAMKLPKRKPRTKNHDRVDQPGSKPVRSAIRRGAHI